MLASIYNKQHRKIVESNIISNYNTIQQRPDFFNLCPYLLPSRLGLKNTPIASLQRG